MNGMLTLFCTLLVSLWSMLSANDSADLLFVGDAMQHQSQLNAARSGRNTYDYSACFAELRPYIQSADYAVVNLETPLGGAPYSGYPMFCAPDEYLDELIASGFDFFLGANNHALDRRDRGVRRTVETFIDRGVPFAGIYRNRAQRDSIVPRIVNVNGFRIAILNYTYGTNGITVREDVVVDPIDRDLIDADIARARERGAELVAVCLHWGEEYRLLPEQWQRRMADWLQSRGVEMVIGSHPHVIQPMELRPNGVDDNTLVVYSLGNFISGMRTTDTRGGAAVRVTLKRDSVGNAYVDGATYRLFFTITPTHGSGRNFRLVPAEVPIEDNAVAEAQRSAFVRSAGEIYRKHNIGVSSDTLQIRSYGK